MMKIKRLAVALSLVAVGLAITVPTAQASAVPAAQCGEFNCLYFTQGQVLWDLYNNSPLRACPATNCAVITYMPATTSLNPGGGWVTSEAYQNEGNPWCIINYRGISGWTGCWRLAGV
jgi:hypothetical protein